MLISSVAMNSLYAQTDANTPFKGICIYIDYPDAPISVEESELELLINSMDYQTPSIQRTFRKYWNEQTRRNIDMTHDIFYFRAPENTTYYKNIGWQESILLWKDALEFVIENNPDYDWSALDYHENTGISSVMILSSSFDPAGMGATHYPQWTLSNGLRIFQIYGSVLQAPWDSDLNMFMNLHESGHGIFGFPDTYDNEYDSGGTSFYTLMSGGKPAVEPVGGPFQVEKNWGHLIEPETGVHTITLRADGDSVFVYRNPHDSLEYFTIEARKKATLGNELFPVDLGLLLWHTDTKVNDSNRQQDMTQYKHYRHSIEQADGLFELENDINIGGNSGDIYLPGDEFSSTTVPSSFWWDGLASDFELYDIQLVGEDKIQFTVNIPARKDDHYPTLSRDNWFIISTPSFITNHEPEKAIDGDVDTYFHVAWGAQDVKPYEFVIDLGGTFTINEINYTANDNFSPPWEGRIEDFQVYISNDLNDWGFPIVNAKFFQTPIRQYFIFPETTGKYLKFSTITTFNNDPRASIAELSFRGYSAPSSANYIETEALYSISPNPASKWFTIEGEIANIQKMAIYNSQGVLIKNTPLNSEDKMDISSFLAGIYFVHLLTPYGKEVHRLLKQ